jgi:hypothetical protein
MKFPVPFEVNEFSQKSGDFVYSRAFFARS